MKLNLHPKEFLALYSLLHSVTPDNPEYSSLNEVKNRMKSYAISALTKKELDPPDDVLLNIWEKTQHDKIKNLEEQNNNLKNMFIFEDKCDDVKNTVAGGKPPQPVVPTLGKVKGNIRL